MTKLGFALVLVGSPPFSSILVVCPALSSVGILPKGLVMIENYLEIQLDPLDALSKPALFLKMRPAAMDMHKL